MSRTYIIRPTEGMVFRKTDTIDKKELFIYATAVNLAASSATAAKEEVDTEWSTVPATEYEQWKAEQQELANSALSN